MDLIDPGARAQLPPPGLKKGDVFPSCRLVILKAKQDLAYLELPPGAKAFALSEVKAQYLLVEFYNELCYGCLKEVEHYNQLFSMIEADPDLRGQLKMIGMGVGSLKREVAKFRRLKGVLFPLFADEKKDVFECLGQPLLPVVYLLHRDKGGLRRILFIHSGQVESPQALLTLIKTRMHAPQP